MYKPRLIEAKDLFSFRELAYCFNSGVTTLVNGKNKDNDSQESNGSGKSSLIEAIAIAITGSPLRKVKLDEVINDSAEEAYLRLTLDNEILNETFVISRRFFRKSASIVSIQIFKDGNEIDDPLLNTLSSVDEYNKAILNRIGLTRDEIFNNFILSRHRYDNFLSVSDTKKKDIINQFSRGNAVDQAISELKVDSKPIKDEVDGIKIELATEEGKLEAMMGQLEEIELSRDYVKRDIEEKISDTKIKISDYRKLIRSNNENMSNIEKSISELDDICESLKDSFDDCDGMPPKEQIKVLIKAIEDNEIDFKQSFLDELSKIESSSSSFDKAIGDYEKSIQKIESDIVSIDRDIKKISSSPALNKDKHDKKVKTLTEDISDFSTRIKSMRIKVLSLRQSKENLESEKSILCVKLMGKVTCPKCDHEFLAAEKGFDIPLAEIKVKDLESDIKSVSDEVDLKTNDGIGLKQGKEKCEEKLNEVEDNYYSLNSKFTSLSSKKDLLESQIKTIKAKISTNRESIKQIDSKIDKFIEDSFNGVIDHIDELAYNEDDSIKALKLDNKKFNGSISNLKERLSDLETNKDVDSTKSIKAKIADLKKSKRSIDRRLQDKVDELNKYLEQEQIFIDFKTHLANSKIDDLGNITNDFLESIGSDLRVELSGFTKLKNGKIREKISIKLLRDGIDAGSFGKFSGGEQARISLANILALSKLININCDDGKGLDLLILDEILEAVDGSGLDNMLSALNRSNVTCLVVSHGLVAENYEYVQTVTKENDCSTIITTA